MKKLLTAYIGIGLLAFVVSSILELIVIVSLTGDMALSVALTAVLECSKLLLTVFHRFVEDKKHKIADAVKITTAFFRTGLFAVSLICSLTYFSSSLDMPNLKQVMEDDKSRVGQNYNEKISALKSQRQERLATIKNEINDKYAKRNQDLDAQYLPKINELEEKRTNEFGRMINGVRKGPLTGKNTTGKFRN